MTSNGPMASNGFVGLSIVVRQVRGRCLCWRPDVSSQALGISTFAGESLLWRARRHSRLLDYFEGRHDRDLNHLTPTKQLLAQMTIFRH